MNATWLEDQPKRSRARFDRALLASLGLHGFLLTLQIGMMGFGLPGLSLPQAEPRAQTVTVRLAEVRPVAPPVAVRKPRESTVVKRPPVPRPPTPKPRKPLPVARKPPSPPKKVVQKKLPQKREVVLNEPRDTSFLMPPPAPRQEEPPKKIVPPIETPEVVPPTPVPPEEVPQPRQVVAEEVPVPEAPREEQLKPEEEVVPEQTGPQEEAPKEEGETERQVAQQTGEEAAGPQGEQASQGQATDDSRGQEGTPRFALDLDLLRQAEEEARLKEEQQRQEATSREQAVAAPEPEPAPAAVPPPEPPPVTDARPARVPLSRLACEEAEALFQTARDLERSGDMKASFQVFKQAAECGHGLAQRKLGDLYGTGNEVVLRDYQTSLKWYRRARDQGIDIPNKPPRYGYR